MLLSTLTVDLITEEGRKSPEGSGKQHPSASEGASWQTNPAKNPEASRLQCSQMYYCPTEVSGRCSPQSPEQTPGPFTRFLLSTNQPEAKVPALLGRRELLASEQLARCLEHDLRKWVGRGSVLGGKSEAGWLC